MNCHFIAILVLCFIKRYYTFFRGWNALGAPYLQCLMLFLQHFVHERQAHLNEASDICCCWSSSTKVCCSDLMLTHIPQVLLRASAHPNHVFALSISTHSNYASFGKGQHSSSLVVACVVAVLLRPAKFPICKYRSMPIQILLLWLWISTHPGSTSRTVGQPL